MSRIPCTLARGCGRAEAHTADEVGHLQEELVEAPSGMGKELTR